MTLPLRGAVDANTCREHDLLRRALVVIHFSPVLKIVDKTGAGIASFQEAIRGTYSQLSSELEHSINVEIGSDMAFQPTMQENLLWKLSDADGRWIVTLTSQSVALETLGEAYKSREDFGARARELVEAIHQHFAPAQVGRIGTRYVNAAPIDAGGTDPRVFCTPELVSISGEQTMLEADLLWKFPVDEGLLFLRSGIVAQGASYDPAMMPPAPMRCWYLDIDVFSEQKASYDVSQISKAIDHQLLRLYEIYRWAIPKKIG